jgi:hypothetical protein
LPGLFTIPDPAPGFDPAGFDPTGFDPTGFGPAGFGAVMGFGFGFSCGVTGRGVRIDSMSI